MPRSFPIIAISPIIGFGILLAGPSSALDAAGPDAQSTIARELTEPDELGSISLQPNHLSLEVYLKKTGYLTAGSEYILYRTGPVSPGGRLKSIFALRFNDISNCGSIGCTQIIVTEDTEGQFTLYDEFVGGDLTMLASQTKDVKDLATSTENGPLLGRFNGTKYTWSPIRGPEVAKPKPEETFPVEITGECIEDRAWHGYRISPTEAAAGYGYCRTNRQANLLLFSCEKDNPEVRVTMNMSTRELDDSEAVVIRLGVGGKSFSLNATAYYDVMSGFVLPEVEPVSQDFALFEALKTAQTTITISINGRQKNIHAEGASDAIKLMGETCR